MTLLQLVRVPDLATIVTFCVTVLWVLFNSSEARADCFNRPVCALPSVVSVLPVWPAEVPRNEEPEGSGIVVSPAGLIATADHVIGPAKKVLVRTPSGEVLSGDIVLRDFHTDVALLKVERKLAPIPFADHSVLGGAACAIGNSFGLDISLTCGVVSAQNVTGTGFNRIEDFVQTDAAVNPGMSGGALVDEQGRLIGMLSAIFAKEADANIGVNFAVSTTLLKRVVQDYVSFGQVRRLVPGLLVRPSIRPGDIGLAGLEVIRVENGSVEQAAGVQPGDVILSVNDRRTKRAGGYVSALALMEHGDQFELHVLRGDQRLTIQVNSR